MSKKNKKNKNIQKQGNSRVDSNPANGASASLDSTADKGDCRVRPVLTGLLVASILAVATVSLIDVHNVYSQYCMEHEEIPQILACVDAVSEGIFPWTEVTAYAAMNDAYADGGPGMVDIGEMAEDAAAGAAAEAADAISQQPNNNHAEAETEPKTVAKQEDRTEEAKTASSSSQEAEAKAHDDFMGTGIRQGETKQFTKVDMSYFSDAAFIGDSFTQGLMLYADIPGADCLCYQSKTTKNIMDSEIHLKNGSTSTVRSELGKKQYGKIYLMLGINELSKDVDGFVGRYQKVINEIRALQPNAIIYVQSIFHTTPNKSANSNFKNNIIDANNAGLAGLANNKDIFYVNVNPPFDDGTGAMRSDYSGDGVHLKASHYKEWRDYLLNFGVK